MEYRKLGKSGLFLSALSYGSWVTFNNQVDIPLAEKLIGKALDSGINFFDNAEVYADGESEIIMGKALKNLGNNRDSYCVSSKVFWGGPNVTQRGLSAKHVYDACHAALKRLQVDYLDLYFCHRPDVDTPIEETVRAMNNLIIQGKILYWGTSEWSAQEIMEAYSVARQYNLTPPTMEQPQYNLFSRNKVEGDYRNLYKNIGLGTTIWSPLASGILTGKYNNGIPENSRASLKGFEWIKEQILSEKGQEKVRKAREFEKLAGELGIPMSRLALGWCLKNKNVSTVILGCSNIKQLEENLLVFDDYGKLDEEIMEKLDVIFDNRPKDVTDYKKI